MRFLVVTKSREAAPFDMALPMMKMTQQWAAEHRASGKMEHVWSFSGFPGGGAIFNVDSHEELDGMMGGFPFSQYSDIEVYALADLDTSLDGAIDRIESMMSMMGAPA